MSDDSCFPLILSHRGLDYSLEPHLQESTLEAFRTRISEGFGLEFDLILLKCGEILISHERDTKTLMPESKVLNFEKLSLEEIRKLKTHNSTFLSLSQLLEMIERSDIKSHALHLKYPWQSKARVEILISYIRRFPASHSKLIIFDIRPDIASLLKQELSDIRLAASVSHPYDIKRYNSVVGGTLISIHEFIRYQNLYDLAWLDEWDLVSENKSTKAFYTESIFQELRKIEKGIALVTPELHATSPGLLGGEVHADGISKDKLFKRIEEILLLKPDLICTDYPKKVKELINNLSFS